jgi:hypothetical protein
VFFFSPSLLKGFKHKLSIVRKILTVSLFNSQIEVIKQKILYDYSIVLVKCFLCFYIYVYLFS